MKKLLLFLCFALSSLSLFGQNCSILAKANNIAPDKLCSPVIVNWNASYTGVNDNGTQVSIQYDWDDGTPIQIIPASTVGPGIFQTTTTHIYTSQGNVCNYHPQVTLMVNRVLCTSSTQEQIVTVWDDDNHNGGHMHINPTVYPICVGNGDNVRFQDLTQFNCVPPQENDVPNVFTRWIQWIYGTDITMTGIPVTINGNSQTFPYTAPIITLPGPVTGSGVWSDIMNVANDKLVGQYFQVTLRNWNYCNPYDDPNIPGLPVDLVNGDYAPVTTTAIILIVPYPDPTITPVGPFCLQNPLITLTAHDSGGTWTGNGVSRNRFNPSAAGVGVHIIKYTITNGSGCTATDQTTITVVPMPDATINPIPNLCILDSTIILSAHDTGGVWSGGGVVGNTFNPSIAGIGNHTITYSITDSNGCTDSDQKTVLVNAYPNATINPIPNMCMSNKIITLVAHDGGGTWSGNGVVGNTFNLSVAGVGTHMIKYVITNGSCINADSVNVSIYPTPDATIITPITNYCVNDAKVTLVAHDTGGIWIGDGIIGNIFDPLAAGIGIHTIGYEIINSFGCRDSDIITTVVVRAAPDATITPISNICMSIDTLTLVAHDFGGVWSGDGVIGNKFVPIIAGIGTHTIKYDINVSGCADVDQIDVTILPTPDATITPVKAICTGEPPITLMALDTGGVWLGDGMTKNIFDPVKAGVGIHEINYSIITSNGCRDSDKIEIQVDATPNAKISPMNNVCMSNLILPLLAHDFSGIWSGEGVIGNTFNPLIAGVGTHIIKYKIINTNCSDSDQISITVYPVPDATITPVDNMCINESRIALTSNDLGGVWTGAGLTGNLFDPKTAGLGNHIIIYDIVNSFGCRDSNHIAIKVMPVPNATITHVDTLCINNIAITLTVHDIGGIWSGAVSTNVFDPAKAGVGTHIIRYNITSFNGCSDSDKINIVVVPIPIVKITPVPILYLNGPIITLNATPINGLFSGEGVVGKTFNPRTAGLGIHIVQYQTIPDRFGCSSSDTIHIKVIMPLLPISNFEPDENGCSPLTVQFINNSLNATSYLWDFGDDVLSTEENPSHTYMTPGNYVVKLIASSIAGQSIHTGPIVVYQNPTAIFNVYPAEVTSNTQIVAFYNYSQYNAYQLWKFGDSETSIENNPWHKYLQEGSYNVTLIVTSSDGCIDSATLTTPIKVNFAIGKIIFPNAFIWNRSGPTGGYWTEGKVDDAVFRPRFENVIEYDLKIFNRWGVLIYESHELYKGWDGYFGSKPDGEGSSLAPQGVYVWKATGRFVDGKYFNQVGDVTFLH